jgi:hypothetical protein
VKIALGPGSCYRARTATPPGIFGALRKPPAGYWTCAMCVEAEQDGEGMIDHGLEGEDDALDGAGFDRSTVDADDEEGETDISEAPYDEAGILSLPPSIWDGTTSAALKRALEPHVPPPVTTATVFGHIRNCVKSTHALSLSVMVAFDAVLSYMAENTDGAFTPARQRSKDLTAELVKAAPTVAYEVRCTQAVSFILNAF